MSMTILLGTGSSELVRTVAWNADTSPTRTIPVPVGEGASVARILSANGRTSTRMSTFSTGNNTIIDGSWATPLDFTPVNDDNIEYKFTYVSGVMPNVFSPPFPTNDVWVNASTNMVYEISTSSVNDTFITSTFDISFRRLGVTLLVQRVSISASR